MFQIKSIIMMDKAASGNLDRFEVIWETSFMFSKIFTDNYNEGYYLDSLETLSLLFY